MDPLLRFVARNMTESLSYFQMIYELKTMLHICCKLQEIRSQHSKMLLKQQNLLMSNIQEQNLYFSNFAENFKA